MKNEIHVRVFYRSGPRGPRQRRIKLLKQMCLASNGAVRMETVVRLLRLPPFPHMCECLRDEDSVPLKMDALIRPRDEEFPVDLNLFVEAEEEQLLCKWGMSVCDFS